ncbi:MAG TPA: ankyrin repeat domain-containing protein [Candidatus Magasanikbacteria bacterium]|nr:ankyrin repeat domain-containing protein [Candidatus Magasanikbacteria bacterium]
MFKKISKLVLLFQVKRMINKGRTEEVTEAVQEGRLSLNDKYPDGDTLLLKACRDGDVFSAQYLINHGADIQVKNSQGKTCLDFAVKHGKVELINSLLAKGATVSRELLRELMINKEKDKLEKILGLLSQKDIDNALLVACDVGDADFYKILVNKANFKCCDEENRSPLMLAMRGRNPEIIIDLVEKRLVDYSVRDVHGNSIHSYAVGPGVSMDLYERVMLAASQTRQK